MEKKIEKKDRSRRKEGKKKLFRHENRNTVEPRSNGIVFITDSYSWSLQIDFFHFFVGNNRSSTITEENCRSAEIR